MTDDPGAIPSLEIDGDTRGGTLREKAASPRDSAFLVRRVFDVVELANFQDMVFPVSCFMCNPL